MSSHGYLSIDPHPHHHRSSGYQHEEKQDGARRHTTPYRWFLGDDEGQLNDLVDRE